MRLNRFSLSFPLSAFLFFTFFFCVLSFGAFTSMRAFAQTASPDALNAASAGSELPHYIKVKDYGASQVILEDSSIESSKLYVCDNAGQSCVATSSPLLAENDIAKAFPAFSSFKMYYTYEWGIGYTKNKVATTTLVSEPVYRVPSDTSTFLWYYTYATTTTVTQYTVSLFTKSNAASNASPSTRMAATSTGIVLDKMPGKALLSENKTAVFIYDNSFAKVYDLTTGKKINEISFLDQPLDSKDPLSYIYFTGISPDGKYFAWYIPYSSSRGYITYGFTESATGRSIIRKENVAFDRVARSGNIFDFSHGGKIAYFISGMSMWNVPWAIDLEKSFKVGREISIRLFEKNYMVTNFIVEGDHFYFVANREHPNVWALYDYNLKTEKLAKLSTKQVSSADNIRFWRGNVFYNYVEEGSGVSVAYYDTVKKTTKYFSPAVPLDAKSKIDVSKYSYVKGARDTIVVGVPDAKKKSDELVVFLHGGPYNQVYTGYHPSPIYGTFDWLLEGARENGAYVAKLDYPGSFGYGVAYTNSLLKNIGTIDMKTLHDSIALIKKKYPSIKKVTLVGISYGGYMAVKDYVENGVNYEHVYALGPVTDWHSPYETGTYSFFNSHFGIMGTTTVSTSSPQAAEILSLYDKADILKKLPSLPATNTLTIYKGTDDVSVDFREAQDFDAAMKAAGKAYTYTVFRGEPHVFARRSSWVKVCTDILAKVGSGNTAHCALAETNPSTEPLILAGTSTAPYTVIGKSVEGRELKAYRFGTGAKEITFVGAIHGGYEWNSALLSFELIQYFTKHPEVIPKNLSVVIIPVANPDGLAKVMGTADQFDQSLAPHFSYATDIATSSSVVAGRFNAHMVDLNRNFACNWQATSTWRTTVTNAGSEAFSEPEVQALRDYFLKVKPLAAIFFHSASGGVYASYCGKDPLAGTIDLLDTYTKASGYKRYSDFTSYAVTGAADDWLSTQGVPAITVEFTTHDGAEWEKNLKGVKALLDLYGKR